MSTSASSRKHAMDRRGFDATDDVSRLGNDKGCAAMTFRIDRLLVEKDLVVLHLSGRITMQDLDVLSAALAQESAPVAIDLAEVDLVDRSAVKLLALTEAKGIELRRCPAYIREWVTKERGRS